MNRRTLFICLVILFPNVTLPKENKNQLWKLLTSVAQSDLLQTFQCVCPNEWMNTSLISAVTCHAVWLADWQRRIVTCHVTFPGLWNPRGRIHQITIKTWSHTQNIVCINSTRKPLISVRVRSDRFPLQNSKGLFLWFQVTFRFQMCFRSFIVKLNPLIIGGTGIRASLETDFEQSPILVINWFCYY